jgi:uncharacterized protein (TIGR02996 family)
MSSDAAFLVAIKAEPGEDVNRLVYADWLDEQGRRGGDFLRIDCKIAALDLTEVERRMLPIQEASELGVVDLIEPGPSDTGYWKQLSLVAELGAAGLGLDEDWMAAVSRVPIHEITARVREIPSWLRRRVRAGEVLARMAEMDQPGEPRRGWWGWLSGLFTRRPMKTAAREEGPHVKAVREWFEANLQPGDELWEYDTEGESWADLCGEMGYAILRDGKVVEYHMILMN